MARDRNWVRIQDPRVEEYRAGCLEFLGYAFLHAAIDGMIKCPCNGCMNKKLGSYDNVHRHLLMKGMYILYGTGLWTFHHEHEEMEENGTVAAEMDLDEMHIANDIQGDDDMAGLLHACLHPAQEDITGEPIPEPDAFRKLMEDADTPLFDGCPDFSKLSFLIGLYHIKCRGKMSNKTFTETLTLIKKAFKVECLPKTFYATKKLIGSLGLDYIKFDVCVNDCMLFWKDDKDLQVCKVCNESRWKNPESLKNKIPVKVLRHFPLIPRLKRLYLCEQTASDMKWHQSLTGREDRRINDGILRHPADSEAWKDFDNMHQSFASDCRNIRLGLATDGFNPFGVKNIDHSTWPVILTVYNLPPHLCMKREYLIMSLLISGPKGPGNNIDVHLQPLVEELQILWGEGVMTFDSSCNEYFPMRAALMWTINDFPAYGTLSGWSTSGYLACPVCADKTVSEHLYKSCKQCYMGHSRLLDQGAPRSLTGEEVLNQTENIEVTFGKTHSPPKDTQWRKRSIFFELPYWKYNLIRHNLDVMHIEKNVCENLIRWLLSLYNKNDGYKYAEEDIELIKKPPMGRPRTRFRNLVPKLRVYHRMSTAQKKQFRSVLAAVKVPDGYASNIKKCFGDGKIYGLKSHDYHILIQVLLPLAVRNAELPKKMASTILDLCRFFKALCSTSNSIEVLNELHLKIVHVICNLENLFPPSFFVVMLHLSVHLADEARIGGPVQYRWMYPIERYLGHLKSFVRNRCRPEGSIAECYITEECLNFCSRYLGGVETVHTRRSKNDDDGVEPTGLSIFHNSGSSSSAAREVKLSYEKMESAHNYCLTNCDELKPYIEEHFQSVKEKFSRSDPKYFWRIQQLQDKEFRKWIQSRAPLARDVGDDMCALIASPGMSVQSYKSFKINGYKFRTKQSEMTLHTQNSGCVVQASTGCFTSTSDRRPVDGDITYYGVIKDIIQLSFDGGRNVVLFECDWADTQKTKTDAYGFTLLDFSRPAKKENPFVLPSQVLQAFYVPDPSNPPWTVPIVTKPRDNFSLRGVEPTDEEEINLIETLPSGPLLITAIAQ